MKTSELWTPIIYLLILFLILPFVIIGTVKFIWMQWCILVQGIHGSLSWQVFPEMWRNDIGWKRVKIIGGLVAFTGLLCWFSTFFMVKQ